MFQNFLGKVSKDPPIHQTTKIIIDTDGGSDDCMAILAATKYIQRNTHIQLLGVTCVWGNTPLQNVIKNILICRKISGLNFPIFKGCDIAMNGRPYTDQYFGQDGINNTQNQFIKNLDQSDLFIQSKHAADFIEQQIQKYPKQITLITIGPLTNLALAILKKQSIAQKLGRLVAMGGTYLGVGLVRDCPNSQFNFHCDGCAVQLIFRFIKQPIIIPFQTCVQITQKTTKQLQSLFQAKEKMANLFISKIFGKQKFIADPIAVLVGLDSTVVNKWLYLPVMAEFDGKTTAILPAWVRVSQKCKKTFIVQNLTLQKIVEFCKLINDI